METILNNLLKLLRLKSDKEEEKDTFKKPVGYKNIHSSKIKET
jgi:hypothetical protein